MLKKINCFLFCFFIFSIVFIISSTRYTPYAATLPGGTNFKITTPVATTLSNVPITDKVSLTFSGYIANEGILSFKLNGVKGSISESIFNQAASLKSGVNKLTFEGYSDKNCVNKIVTEDFYIVRNPNAMHINNLKYPSNTNTSISAGGKYTITGMLSYSITKKVEVNNTPQVLNGTSKQFSFEYTLVEGLNKINTVTTYEQAVDGVNYSYSISKNYNLFAPINFKLITELSKDKNKVNITNNPIITFSGFVSNYGINSLKINGTVVTIKNEQRQFDFKNKLRNGINIVNVQGFSDKKCLTKIADVNYYIVKNPNGITCNLKPITIAEINPFTVVGRLMYPMVKGIVINGALQDIMDYRIYSYIDSLIPGKYNPITTKVLYEQIYYGVVYNYSVTNNYTIIAPSDANNKYVKVSSISLYKTTDKLEVGNTDTLEAKISPTNATDGRVTFTSSNNKIATVDNNGKVTGISEGLATITATTIDGSKTATCSITVNKPIIKVKTVSLNKTTDSLTVGATNTITVTVNPTDATNKLVKWTSSDNKIATVDDNGNVTGISKGIATISVTTVDGSKMALCTISVETLKHWNK